MTALQALKEHLREIEAQQLELHREWCKIYSAIKILQ